MTDPTIATPKEMLSALERWATAQGIHSQDAWAPFPKGWLYFTVGGQPTIEWRDDDPLRSCGWADVGPEIAIAWALTVEAGLEAVDVGPCPACVKRVAFEWSLADSFFQRDRLVRDGWTAGVQPQVMAEWPMSRPCPDCNGTGRDLCDPARLVLEVAAEPGDPKSLEALTALADHLQPHAFDRRDHDPAREAAGHALAHLVALWLDGDPRETKAAVEALTRAWERLTVPCERCGGAKTRELKSEPFSNRSEAARFAEFLGGSSKCKSKLIVGDRGAWSVVWVEDCIDCGGHGRVKPRAARPSSPPLGKGIVDTTWTP